MINREAIKQGGSYRNARGDILISVLIFAAITVTVVIGLVNWGAAMLAGIRNTAAREQALQIAEAGVDYYQWHLAQYPTDYADGTTTPAPYVHKFYDKDGDLLGWAYAFEQATHFRKLPVLVDKGLLSIER